MACIELFSISKRTNEMLDGLLKEGTSHIQSPFLFFSPPTHISFHFLIRIVYSLKQSKNLYMRSSKISKRPTSPRHSRYDTD